MENNLDIIAVQETKIESQDQTDRMVDMFKTRYYVCVSHAVGRSGGCAVYIRNTIGFEVQHVFSCVSGRLIVCDISLSGTDFRIICIYAPNAQLERKEFFERVERYVETERHVILLGDFNCVCHADDRAANVTARDSSAVLLNTMVHDKDLEDIGRTLSAGKPNQYTHFQNGSQARLDRVYVSADLVPVCNYYDVKHVSFSDHSLVVLVIGTEQKKPKFCWDLWKLNARLLQDEVFAEKVKEKIKLLLLENDERISVGWETFKQEVKMDAIERASTLRRKEKEKENELLSELKFLMSAHNTQIENNDSKIKQVKTELELIDAEKYKGAIIRARAEKLWFGERPTKRALCDEKRYATQNEIKAVEYEGRVTQDRATIQQAFYEHYRDLLGRKRDFDEGFKQHFLPLMPKLESEIKTSLEEPITLQEIKRAIDDLSPGKAPGPDGLGACFYKTFKLELATVLHRVIVQGYERKQLPRSFCESHVVLIPKSDDPVKLLSVKGYRPISLTNVDYKVYMKVLARRVQGIITTIVGSHQTCGIMGRSIMTNIHVARSVLECVDTFGGQVAILQLDLEKAFDFVAHEILFEILEHVNIGSVILEGVKMSYSQCTTRLIVNKNLSERIAIRSSIRQGCPLAPLLFAIYLEPFCLSILNSDKVRGFRLNSSEVKILAYADDVAVICEDKPSVRAAVEKAKMFCKHTGSTVNWGKCVGFWHGEWEGPEDTFENVQWTTTPSKYLGVPLDQYRDMNSYWAGEIERIREKTTKWGGRELSMFTRATVCNLFLAAKVWYVLQVLCITRTNIQRLHRVFAVFVWGSTWERMSRSNLFLSVKSGGLGLVHLFLKQVVSRFLFLRDQSDSFVRTIIQVRMRDALPDYIVSSSGVRRSRLRGFLREVVWSFQFLKVRFSLEYLSGVSRKQLYKDVIDICLPVPVYRSMGVAGTARNVLKRVRNMPVKASTKSFFFQLHTGTLPVKPWLQERGIFVPWDVNCVFCHRPETVEHIFLDCSDAVFHWDVLQRTLKKELPITPYGIRFLPTANEDGVPYDMFILLSLHSLWKPRMDVRHANPNGRPAKDYFRESVAYIRDIFNLQEEQPSWVPILDNLVKMKLF